MYVMDVVICRNARKGMMSFSTGVDSSGNAFETDDRRNARKGMMSFSTLVAQADAWCAMHVAMPARA